MTKRKSPATATTSPRKLKRQRRTGPNDQDEEKDQPSTFWETLEPLKGQPSKKKKANMRTNPQWNFSLRYSIPKDKCKVYAEGLVPEFTEFLLDVVDAKKYIFQLEDSWKDLSDEQRTIRIEACNEGRDPALPKIEHNLHYQVWCNLNNKTRKGTLCKLVNDTKFKGMNISVSSTAGQKALKTYCMKKKTRVAGPWADSPLYLGADLITREMFTIHQKKMHMFLHTICPIAMKQNRLVHWIYCPLGGSGKSAFAKFCAYWHKWPVFTYASAKDILYIVSKFQNKKVYFFNLSKTRSADVSQNELYAALESVKDGMFTSTKYDPLNVLMNPSHTIVFANHLPPKLLMTQKRFKIHEWKPLPDRFLDDSEAFDWGDDEIMTDERYAEEFERTTVAAPPRRNLGETNNTY